jgi:hypothetical protein
MPKNYLLLVAFLITVSLYSCSKRTHPSRTPDPTIEENNNAIITKKNDSLLAKKAIIKHKSIVPLPKVIIVNDSAAHKSVDGRYYYDVMGHRYWRNNKDGKYYLFNKSMYNNPAFK